MPKLPTVTAKETIGVVGAFREKPLQDVSHSLFSITIPIHGNKNLGKGLLRKILRDSELSVEEFIEIL